MITVDHKDFDIAQEYKQLRHAAGDAGAVVTFTGLVRELYQAELGGEATQSLYLEHYPGMTEKSLELILGRAKARWDVLDARIIHRIGTLLPGDQIVFVGVASAHRQDAFNASQYIMDFLKSEAPFWKKQTSDNGSDWIESRKSDFEALKTWK
ncbi:MAG: molybdopterin synthase catalytic subunit MoaE [Gammaproteobacteria bacterium]|nr:molybdopterin synthase catalytic subunit MoaE [Gammaproteobacteria bacterium]